MIRNGTVQLGGMGVADERMQSVIDLIGRIVRTEGVHGAGIAVLFRGQLVVEHYEGFAGPGRDAGPKTLWPLASISKLYTAAMLVRMVELGELTLSTRIQSVLPRMKGEGRERISLRQLLTHTAGLIYESPDMPKLMERQTPLATIVDEVYERPLAYAPGSDQLYSDLGYALAGRVGCVVAQDEFDHLVRELVLEPAGLADTYFP